MNKFILSLISFVLLIYSADADTNRKAVREQFKEKFRNYSTEQFIEQTKDLKKKTEQKISEKYNLNKKELLKSRNTTQTQSSNLVEIPENAVYPAEFEELQAVLIAWPYYSVDAKGEIQQLFDPVFEGLAIHYDFQKQEYLLIEIENIVDVFDESPYPKIFAQLADAIQKEVPVWINIWAAEDSLEIMNYMAHRGTPLVNYRFFVNPGNSFWYRDCGPVGFYYDEDYKLGFLNFEYYGGRPLDDDLPINIGNEIGVPVFTTSVEFEGGNILTDGDGTLFTTSAVYELNADDEGRLFLDSTSPYGFSITEKIPMSNDLLKDSLRYLMNLKNLRILDKLRNDGGTGHIDLYADFYDENTFVFSRMPDNLSFFPDYNISRRNVDSLVSLSSRNGNQYLKRYIPFPRKDNGNWYVNVKDYERYTRTYSNHIFVNKTIIQPVFYNETSGHRQSNEEALEAISKAYPGYNIVPIDVRAFDGFGGAIHCITKQIPAENPLRIFHYPVQMSDKIENGFPVWAEILNKSGIEKAIVHYKKRGDNEWNFIELSERADNKFYGVIPTEGYTEYDQIHYYISARSNNGKTINKPMPAPEGFYTVDMSPLNVDEQAFDIIGEFFPNPSKEYSSIELKSENTGKIVLSIFNSNGINVYSNEFDVLQSYDVLTINTTLLSNGAYFVRIQFDNGKVFFRQLNVIR